MQILNIIQICCDIQIHFINNFSCFLWIIKKKMNIQTFGDNPEIDQYESKNPLAPVYKKVKQLTDAKRAREQEEQAKIFKKQIVQDKKKTLSLNIDRVDEFIQKRIQGFISADGFKTQNFRSTKNQQNKLFTRNRESFPKLLPQKRSQSQRVLKFLRDNRDAKKQIPKPDTPEFVEKPQEPERQIFTPMRPFSKISGRLQSISGISVTSKSIHSKSQHKSSGGYSQAARLSQAVSSKSSTPSQYLRKGHRMRENLKKQFENQSGIQEEGQLAYLREYDQWVPAAFVNYKKMQLDHFMNIMFGGKKIQNNKSSQVFQPIYL